MEDAGLFDELYSLLKKAGIEIRVEPFKTPSERAGGLCRMKGKNLVLLDSGASPPERARALMEVVESLGLKTLGVSGKDLSPRLLSVLSRRGRMTWPHKKDAPPLAKAGPSPSPALHLVGAPKLLSNFTTMGVGGAASRFSEAITESDVIDAARDAQRLGRPLYPLGGGSNVVVADEGVRGTVLRMSLTGIRVVRRGDHVLVTAAAGEPWHDLAAQMTAEKMAGFECLGGIPGCVGATPIQNVGAYGQEVSQTVVSVRVLDRTTLKIEEFDNERCEFSYRNSVFKGHAKDRYLVLAVTYRLTPEGAPQIRYGELTSALDGDSSVSLSRVFETVVELRRRKSMVLDPEDENYRSCGSFFLNAQISQDQVDAITSVVGQTPPTFPGEGGMIKVPSAWLIEHAGLQRGTRHGPVGLSTKHTLSIVAHPGARATDIVQFAREVRSTVERKFGVTLMPEPHFWGFDELEDGLPVL